MTPETETQSEAVRPEDRFKGRLQLALVAGFLIGTYCLYLAFQFSKVPPQIAGGETFHPTVAAVTLKPQAAPLTFEFYGTVRARNYIAVTPEVSGRVTSISPDFRVGGTIKAGKALFQIDRRDYDIAFANAKSVLQKAEANLSLVKAEAAAALTEWNLLHPGKNPPATVAKKPQIAQARADIAAAKAGVAAARLNVRRTVFTLPTAGRVIEAKAEPGQYVQAGTQQGLILPPGATEISVRVESDKAERFIPGKTAASARLQDEKSPAQRTFNMRLTRTNPTLDPESRYAELIFASEKTDNILLKPGRFVEVTVTEAQNTPHYRVPASALEDNQFLRVIGADRKISRIAPKIYARNGDTVLIAAEDETKILQVADGAADGLIDGIEVEILAPKTE